MGKNRNSPEQFSNDYLEAYDFCIREIVFEKKQETVENSDGNGDFESWLTRIENGECSPIEYYYWRTRASLTDNESRSLKSGDENFWRMFRKGLLDDEIFLCDEEDRLVVDRYCTRCSFILEK